MAGKLFLRIDHQMVGKYYLLKCLINNSDEVYIQMLEDEINTMIHPENEQDFSPTPRTESPSGGVGEFQKFKDSKFRKAPTTIADPDRRAQIQQIGHDEPAPCHEGQCKGNAHISHI